MSNISSFILTKSCLVELSTFCLNIHWLTNWYLCLIPTTMQPPVMQSVLSLRILGLTQKNEPQGQFMNCPYGKMRLSGLFCVSPIYIALLLWLSTEKPLFPKLGIFAVVVSKNWRVSLMHQGVHHHLLSYFAIIATIQAIWLALIVMVRFV